MFLLSTVQKNIQSANKLWAKKSVHSEAHLGECEYIEGESRSKYILPLLYIRITLTKCVGYAITNIFCERLSRNSEWSIENERDKEIIWNTRKKSEKWNQHYYIKNQIYVKCQKTSKYYYLWIIKRKIHINIHHLPTHRSGTRIKFWFAWFLLFFLHTLVSMSTLFFCVLLFAVKFIA